MSEDTPSEDEIEETYRDEPRFTIDVNDKRFGLTESFRDAIEERAQQEYSDNEYVSCWWKVADSSDAEDEESIHEVGDPVLVIETVGNTVPWERLDQLQFEMQDTSAFDGFEDSDDSVRTMNSDDDDDTREKERSHFGVTPDRYEEVPSPEGEEPDKIPQMPEELDGPAMVKWVPDDPDRTHTWATGEAITSVDSWVEWNVQQKALQPLPESDGDLQDHYESMLTLHDCEKVAELQQSQEVPSESKSGTVERKGEDWFDGDVVGDRWNV